MRNALDTVLDAPSSDGVAQSQSSHSRCAPFMGVALSPLHLDFECCGHGLAYDNKCEYVPLIRRASSPSHWSTVLADPINASYVALLKSAVSASQSKGWMEKLIEETFWHQPISRGRRMPRKTAWFVEPGCKCPYKYSSVTIPPDPPSPTLSHITSVVAALVGIPSDQLPNACNANWYADGTQMVGWHADDEPLFAADGQHSVIISLSLGAARDFSFKKQLPAATVHKISLANGDVCTMEGAFQSKYLHSVQRQSRVCGQRINLTWRWIRHHVKGCCPSVSAPVGHPTHIPAP